jgi:hypothetical protein
MVGRRAATLSAAAEDEDQVWERRSAGISWREVDDEVIVLNLKDDSYLRLNPAGAALWAGLELGATTGQLAEILSHRFGIGIDQARTEAFAFLQDCEKNGLIELKS